MPSIVAFTRFPRVYGMWTAVQVEPEESELRQPIQGFGHQGDGTVAHTCKHHFGAGPIGEWGRTE